MWKNITTRTGTTEEGRFSDGLAGEKSLAAEKSFTGGPDFPQVGNPAYRKNKKI
jgi:hypothetical protein